MSPPHGRPKEGSLPPGDSAKREGALVSPSLSELEVVN